MYCRVTPLDAEAATQDQKQLSQSKEQAHIHSIGCCCRCYTWPVGSPPLQQISHGKLHTGHSRTGRHRRATPLDAAAATQDHQVLSQNRRAGEHEQHRHPQSQHVPRCGTGTVTQQGTKAQKATPSRLVSPKLYTHDSHWKEATTLQHTCVKPGKVVGSSVSL
jgi:hypothetical protein